MVVLLQKSEVGRWVRDWEKGLIGTFLSCSKFVFCSLS